MFDDIAYSYRCNHMTVADRQKFVLKGQAWKQRGVNPLNDLRVNQLRAELEAHEETTEGKKKPELEGIFFELRAGICNVPALLQHNMTASLSSLHLDSYEICPTEPLHDIKGHLANVISEIQHLLTGNSRVEYEKAIAALLSKETLRASDYRKATIVLYSIMFKHSCNADLINVLRTATEITEILYAPPSNRTATTILRLHNVCFEHGMLCAKVFSTPRTLTRRSMFGRYFHSLTTHAPIVFHTTPFSSVHTEREERMFNQIKQITLTTSSRRPNDILQNALIRIQEEGNTQTFLPEVNSEIAKLASILPAKENTYFSWEWIKQNRVH